MKKPTMYALQVGVFQYGPFKTAAAAVKWAESRSYDVPVTISPLRSPHQ